jgi:hypothetical protein
MLENPAITYPKITILKRLVMTKKVRPNILFVVVSPYPIVKITVEV